MDQNPVPKHPTQPRKISVYPPTSRTDTGHIDCQRWCQRTFHPRRAECPRPQEIVGPLFRSVIGAQHRDTSLSGEGQLIGLEPANKLIRVHRLYHFACVEGSLSNITGLLGVSRGANATTRILHQPLLISKIPPPSQPQLPLIYTPAPPPRASSAQ